MALSGDYYTDWRRDPIDNTFYPESITNEVCDTVIILGTNGKRGFYLIEVPDPNATVTITRTHIVDGGGNLIPDPSPPTYTQVTNTPGVNEYVVNFERGLIILNAGEYNNTYNLGSRFEVAYDGLGSQMNVRNTQYIEAVILNSKVSRDGSLAMTGNLNLGSQKIVSLANGTNANDGVNKSQLDLKVNKSGDTMSGALAMGNNKITGLGLGTSNGDAVEFSQLTSKALFGALYQSIGIGATTISDNKKLFDIGLNFTTGAATIDFTGVSDTDGDIFFISVKDEAGGNPGFGIKINGTYAKDLAGNDFTYFELSNPSFYSGDCIFCVVFKIGSTWNVRTCEVYY